MALDRLLTTLIEYPRPPRSPRFPEFRRLDPARPRPGIPSAPTSSRQTTPPDKGTPVARRGRKATGQTFGLIAGLPRERRPVSPGGTRGPLTLRERTLIGGQVTMI